MSFESIFRVFSFIIFSLYSFSAFSSAESVSNVDTAEACYENYSYQEFLKESIHYNGSQNIKPNCELLVVSEVQDSQLVKQNEINQMKLVSQLAEINHLKKSISDLGLGISKNSFDLAISDSLKQNNDNSLTAVLAAATLVITALGVTIAIISFIGYKNMSRAATNSARDASLKASEDFMKMKLDDGAFDKLIMDHIEFISMRGIIPVDKHLETDEDTKD